MSDLLTVAPPRRPGIASPPDRLRIIAARVRRLAVSGRLDPECVYVEKSTIAAELVRLARELER